MAGRFFVLNLEEQRALMKKQSGKSGFQTFMKRLQSQYRMGDEAISLRLWRMQLASLRIAQPHP